MILVFLFSCGGGKRSGRKKQNQNVSSNHSNTQLLESKFKFKRYSNKRTVDIDLDNKYNGYKLKAWINTQRGTTQKDCPNTLARYTDVTESYLKFRLYLPETEGLVSVCFLGKKRNSGQWSLNEPYFQQTTIDTIKPTVGVKLDNSFMSPATSGIFGEIFDYDPKNKYFYFFRQVHHSDNLQKACTYHNKDNVSINIIERNFRINKPPMGNNYILCIYAYDKAKNESNINAENVFFINFGGNPQITKMTLDETALNEDETYFTNRDKLKVTVGVPFQLVDIKYLEIRKGEGCPENGEYTLLTDNSIKINENKIEKHFCIIASGELINSKPRLIHIKAQKSFDENETQLSFDNFIHFNKDLNVTVDHTKIN